MWVTFDSEKRERTLQERGLDFEDAKFVFSGDTLEVEDAARITVKHASFASAILLGVWLWLATRRVARFATSSA